MTGSFCLETIPPFVPSKEILSTHYTHPAECWFSYSREELQAPFTSREIGGKLSICPSLIV
jgi:hypothetical protein